MEAAAHGVVLELTAGEPIARDRVAAAPLRRAEWVILAFLSYAVGLACVAPVSRLTFDRIVVTNLAVGLIYGVVIRRDSAQPKLALSVVRDWAPLAVIILAYREMGWFAVAHGAHTLEARWVVLDRLVLPHARAAIEILGPVLPAMLEIAYALVYALAPFAVALLYLSGRRKSVDRFLVVFALGVLLCYAQFPFWPSEPPRVVFSGEDLPGYLTVFRRFNLWMLGEAGIHTSVFPSAHVAGAFSVAFGMRAAAPDNIWIYRLLLVMAGLIAVATVYGRYHYMADALAGFAVAALVAAVTGKTPGGTRQVS